MNTDHHTSNKYRPDIDGLRAIAVLSVVGYHTFPNFFKGGFVGVDVFFVISGYLISRIIFNAMDVNQFSFVDFYSRRIKRIFPALILVLLSCMMIGWWTLFADEYKQLGKHTAAGAAFISNLVLWDESGYFDNDAITKPLLHLWSLGVEEQFYIVWPLILWVAYKFRVQAALVIVGVALFSFVLNVTKIHIDIISAFYSPQSRFWELLFGSLLGWMTINRETYFQQLSSFSKECLSLTGCILLIVSFILMTDKSLFPGWWALLPVVGTVLVIAAGPLTWINRHVFSFRVLVWFGLISFPLYLWHWPLLSDRKSVV
jgi:peptidoglycan/LPS O-acetylase OafA/YrhL